MLLDSKPQIIDKGIAIYCPRLENIDRYLLELKIYYSLNYPEPSLLFECDNQRKIIWQATHQVIDRPALFLYKTAGDLPGGFYTLELTASTNNKVLKGSKIIGSITPTPRLIIGLLYSIYTAINLS